MIRLQWSRKIFTIVAAAAIVLAGLAGLMRPKPFSDSGLSPQWQCSKTAGFLVTCTHQRSQGLIG
ncbi:hypothetical protein FFI89_014385 [Bradyrhizobium sp. KBS0727]|uniref:hypothetical protein n=1 Tax=unclassified Bradyrhizobium TaxID=2631580 RepID=UPI00110EB366|nr:MULTISPECIES: hypothetical protein [unclassified Bradyrhizobium]QDW38230.1 hypothetical protein FFI71_014380 [Bradyrhizobium sp. KBS0725]QDW44833.1 hypothetical protein FFI89_014385 [Bradyrhizobium sp. KBS0727]